MGDSEMKILVNQVLKRNQRLMQVVLVIFELVLFILYARLRILNARSIRAPRMSFGDTTDYLLIASQSLFSSKFWLADKPFVIPLFFKILGGNPHTIFTVQLYFSIFCWGILAITCAYIIRSYPLKFFVFAVVLGFSLSQQVILWDSLLLSKSLHFSLIALFYASGFLLIKHWNVWNIIAFIFLAALLVFTRDANAYMLLMAGVILLFLVVFKQHTSRFLLIGGSFIIIFAISSVLSSAGDHSYSAVLNIVGMRILPNQEYRTFFEHQGMPMTNSLLQYSGDASHWNGLAMMQDPRLAAFREWVQEHGTFSLIKFLWRDKSDTLQRPLNDPVTVLAPNLYYYSATGFAPILENSRFSEVLYPMDFGVIVFWLANMFAAFISAFAIQRKKVLWLLPLLMILLAYPQIVFVWNTDPNDLLRHSLHLNVQWRLGLWVLVFLLVDYSIERLMPWLSNLYLRSKTFFNKSRQSSVNKETS